MKKLSTIIMALALVLGMSQCKKQETPTTGNTTPTNPGVHITVNVGDQDGKDGKDNNGEKHYIAPAYGLFSFSNNDMLYVGHNGKYVGTLTFANGFFSGTIYPDASVTDQPLHFYFVGNAAVTGTPVAEQTTSLSIDIADQSANLPVLSYGASNEFYTGPNNTYSTTLKNKCAMVRFDLQNQGDYEVTLSGVPTQATVDFANNAITPNTSTTGDITLYGEEGVITHRWAILLPGTDLTTGHGDLNITYSGDVNLAELAYNDYVNSGISINNPLPLPDAPDAEYAVKNSDNVLSQFTVNANGKKVYFSKANLRFVGFNNNTGSWSFHENQVDASSAWPEYGDNNIDIPSGESTNDRFAWGLYGNHGMYEDDWPAITTNLSKADGNDWGCAFSETSSEGDNWRTLTIDEWNYLFNGRSQQKRFLKVTLKMEGTPNAVQGILLFPDDYVEPAGLTKTFTYNFNTSASTGSCYVVADGDKFVNAKVYTDPTSNSYKMLAAGAVFLPAAGYRIQQWYQMYYCHQPGAYTGSLNWDAYGYYWSSTSGAYNEFSHTSRAFYFDRSRVGEATSYQDRSHGMCVRLVWDAN